MSPAVLGLIAAFGWGTADFIARFTGRALGIRRGLFAMLLVGTSAVILTWLARGGMPGDLAFGSAPFFIAIGTGFGFLIATLLFYRALVDGPVTVAAPIVGAYPVFNLAIAVFEGHVPTAGQWIAIAIVLGGAVLVSRAEVGDGTSDEASERDPGVNTGNGPPPASVVRRTILLSAAAGFLFAVTAWAGQGAAAAIGELSATVVGRVTALFVMLAVVLVMREPMSIPAKWWPVAGAQGVLDAAAFLAIVAAHGPEGKIAVVVSAGFSAVTVILARTFLKEAMTLGQWLGVAAIIGGAAYLSAP